MVEDESGALESNGSRKMKSVVPPKPRRPTPVPINISIASITQDPANTGISPPSSVPSHPATMRKSVRLTM